MNIIKERLRAIGLYCIENLNPCWSLGKNISQHLSFHLGTNNGSLVPGSLSAASLPKMSIKVVRAGPKSQLGVLFEESARLNQDMQSELKQTQGKRWVCLYVVGSHEAELIWKISEAGNNVGEDITSQDSWNFPVVLPMCSTLESFPFFPLQWSGSLIPFGLLNKADKGFWLQRGLWPGKGSVVCLAGDMQIGK